LARGRGGLKIAKTLAQERDLPETCRTMNHSGRRWTNMTDDGTPWPVEIRLNAAKDTLHVAFDSGDAYDFSAEFLRVHSPSAEIKGHGNEERKIIGGKQAVTIARVEAVGNYAVRLIFSDGHETGIFSWAYLDEVGRDHGQLWAQYLRDLEKRGLKRS
jgi:DUF971 family protein